MLGLGDEALVVRTRMAEVLLAHFPRSTDADVDLLFQHVAGVEPARLKAAVTAVRLEAGGQVGRPDIRAVVRTLAADGSSGVTAAEVTRRRLASERACRARVRMANESDDALLARLADEAPAVLERVRDEVLAEVAKGAWDGGDGRLAASWARQGFGRSRPWRQLVAMRLRTRGV
jgi:hypothetical protein